MIHPGKCCLEPSPVGFNRPIISQSLFLEFSCANPATPFAQFHLFSKLSLPVSIARLFLEASFSSYLGPVSHANPPCSGPFIFEIPLTATIHAWKGAAETPLTALSRLAASIGGETALRRKESQEWRPRRNSPPTPGLAMTALPGRDRLEPKQQWSLGQKALTELSGMGKTNNLSEKGESAQIPIWQHSHFSLQMVMCKSLKNISGMFLDQIPDQLQPSLQPNT